MGKVLFLSKKPPSDGEYLSEEETQRKSVLSPSPVPSIDDVPEFSVKRIMVRLLANNKVCIIFPNLMV